MEFLIPGIIVFCIFLIIASMKKAPSNINSSSGVESSSNKTMILTTKLDKTTTMKTIMQYAQTGNYKVDSFNEANYTLVLSDSASFTSYGYFYLIALETNAQNETVVTIGIKSKIYQIGSGLTNILEKFGNGIKAALYVGDGG